MTSNECCEQLLKNTKGKIYQNFVKKILGKSIEEFEKARIEHYSQILKIAEAEKNIQKVCKKCEGNKEGRKCDAIYEKLLEDLKLIN